MVERNLKQDLDIHEHIEDLCDHAHSHKHSESESALHTESGDYDDEL